MKNPVLLILAALVALTVSCTEFETVELGVCGNRVLEAGEDCDGAAILEGGTCAEPDTENACFYTCDDTGCPEGWSCGRDLRCRQSAGGLRLNDGGPWPFDVRDIAIGDVDGDGVADIIGNDQETISVRFGSETTSFEEVLEVRANQNNPITYADFDGDSRLDVLIPNDNGLSVLRGSSQRDLVSVPFSQFELGEVRIDLQLVKARPGQDVVEQVLFVDPERKSFYSRDTSEGQTFPNNFPACPNGLAGCTDPLPTDVVSPMTTGDLLPDEVGALDEVVVLFHGHRFAYVYKVNLITAGACNASEPGCVLDFEFLEQPSQVLDLRSPVRSAGIVLDLDFDGHNDLMVMTGEKADTLTPVVAFGNGTVLETPQNLPQDSAFGKDSFRDEVNASPLAYAQTEARTHSFVFPNKILTTFFDDGNPLSIDGHMVPNGFNEPPLVTGGPWKSARVADLNGDSRMDFVVSDGSDTIEVYLGTSVPSFLNRFLLDAGGSVLASNTCRDDEGELCGSSTLLRVADFDGDSIDDIAFVRPGGFGAEDELLVAYGSGTGAFSKPVSMGRLGEILTLLPVLLSDPSGFDDLVYDLLVLSSVTDVDGKKQRVAAIFAGDSSRRMLSPLALLPPPATEGQASCRKHEPIRALVGDFVEGENKTLDVMVVGHSDFACPSSATVDDTGTGTGTGTDTGTGIGTVPTRDTGMGSLWIFPGTGEASLSTVDRQAVFEVGASLEEQRFGTDCATWAVGRLGTDERDSLVGVDGCDSDIPDSDTNSLLVAGVAGVDLQTNIQTLGSDSLSTLGSQLADVDGDGDIDSLLWQTTEDGEHVLGVVWDRGEGLEVGEVTTVLRLPVGERLGGFKATSLNSDSHLDLLYIARADANRDVLFSSLYDPLAGSFGDAKEIFELREGEHPFDAGDLNGDSLTDVVVVSDGELWVYLGTTNPPLGGELEIEE